MGNYWAIEGQSLPWELPSFVQDAREAWGSVRQRARLARLPVVHEPEPEATVVGWEVGCNAWTLAGCPTSVTLIPSFGTRVSVSVNDWHASGHINEWSPCFAI